jgi:heme O synthase-like polyprenyltransferase
MVEYGSSSHWHYEMTPMLSAEAYAYPWLDVRTHIHLSEMPWNHQDDDDKARKMFHFSIVYMTRV